MKKYINHVTVLGSGVMGTGIAALLAGVGIEVLMLDMPPQSLTDKQKAQGLTLEDKSVRNSNAQYHLSQALKANPAPFYDKSFAKRITVGNFEDDLPKIKDSDWVIEVIVERLDIKNQMFDKVEKYRKPGTFVSTNTSGIPIHLMSKGRSQEFQEHFLGTHFFNPPRYLKLFEIIPGPETKPEVISFFQKFSEEYLGKQPVLAKDTPGFIGNRIGVYSMAKIMELGEELGLSIEEADTLTGSILGRPKTGTFKLADLVGLDTAYKVTKGLQENAKEDQMVKDLKESKPLGWLLEQGFVGDKARKGFYYKERDKEGNTSRYALDLKTLEYRPLNRENLAIIEQAKQAGGTKQRWETLLKDDSKYGKFIQAQFAALFAYSANRIPEISDDIYAIDDGMKAGYAWKYGPFESWDLLGFEKGIELIEQYGYTLPDWVKTMQSEGITSFYKINEKGRKQCYDIHAKSYQNIPGLDHFIILDNIRKTKEVWSNAECSIQDIGDGILNIEFRSKMNAIGGGVIQGVQKGISLAEENYKGVVIGNQGTNFSVGANLAMIMMFAADQDWFELNMAIKQFQDTMMRIRYSNVPVVVAPHTMTLGGGCEMVLHADKVVAAAETYIGLVEFGVGLIPGGGGTKEMARRASLHFAKDDVKTNRLRDAFMNIATAKVATSAYEALDMDILEPKDHISINQTRQIADAKQFALAMANAGYRRPAKDKVKVLGRNAMGMIYVGTDSMESGRYISEHDRKIANKLGYVMTGGNLSEATEVSEQYLLDLEREAFLSLCGERKTLERIQHMLKTGRPLRN